MNSSESVIGVKTRSMNICERVLQPRIKRDYCHITKEKKAQLIQTVLKQKCKIKKIAKDLNINYATAKTILHCFKKKKMTFESDPEVKRVSVGSIKEDSKLWVQIKVADQTIKHYEYYDEIKRIQ
ncbi:unnamed protein product [Paramecium primaurelia]|uniref:Uncharacterized protein n=1 Tax=Paramecium primaurelia TaxID=5886 RepID=A0A8S1KSU6_PARPR|nr:unnamed protein product [Paramecium primaurelia]